MSRLPYEIVENSKAGCADTLSAGICQSAAVPQAFSKPIDRSSLDVDAALGVAVVTSSLLLDKTLERISRKLMWSLRHEGDRGIALVRTMRETDIHYIRTRYDRRDPCHAERHRLLRESMQLKATVTIQTRIARRRGAPERTSRFLPSIMHFVSRYRCYNYSIQGISCPRILCSRNAIASRRHGHGGHESDGE